MYKVIKMFTDLQDNGYRYEVGDTFPRPDHGVTVNRLEELSTDKNRRKTPLIKLVEPEPEPEIMPAPVEASADITGAPVEEGKPKKKKENKKC